MAKRVKRKVEPRARYMKRLACKLHLPHKRCQVQEKFICDGRCSYMMEIDLLHGYEPNEYTNLYDEL